MSIWYVKKLDKKINWIRKIFNPVNITQVQNKMIVELPNEKYVVRLAKKMYERQNQNLVLASNLKVENFQNICNILDGRWIFKYMLPNVIDYISEKMNRDSGLQEIAVMTNDNSENNLKMLAELAQKVKLLSIVTEDLDKFKHLEEFLMGNMGIVIRTTNNKKKALNKSNIILNLDFQEGDINKYSIPKQAIFVSTNDKIVIKSRRFEGININFYSIELPEEYNNWFKTNGLLAEFEHEVLLESMLYYKKSYDAIQPELRNVKIKHLIGNNGIIQDAEFLKKFTENLH